MINIRKHWLLKAVIQKIISFFPYDYKLNYFFQKYITKGLVLTEERFLHKLRHAKDHIYYLKKYLPDTNHLTVLELGTGWYPVVPIILYLNDIDKIISIDIRQWMNFDNQRITVNLIANYIDSGNFINDFPDYNIDRWNKLKNNMNENSNILEFNKLINLDYLIMDARKLVFEDYSIDFICSNNVFEHIYPNILIDILIEFKRVLKKNGIMSHFIDCTDHYANFDTKINYYNFLRFNEKIWKLIDNSIQPQSRLRFNHYKEIYRELAIPVTEEHTTKGTLSELSNVKINKEFITSCTLDEILIYNGYIISQMN